jgi:hypothetical protein
LRAEATRSTLLKRRVIQVKAGGGGSAALLADAPDGHSRVAGGLLSGQSQSGHCRLQVRDGLDALLVQRLLGLRGNGQRHTVDGVAMTRCSNNNFLKRVTALGLRKGRTHRGDGARPNY